MAKHTHSISTFTVIGRGTFPLDMLRYDMAWPVSGEDAAKMEPAYRELREIKLATVAIMITPERWRSFGWSVKNGTALQRC